MFIVDQNTNIENSKHLTEQAVENIFIDNASKKLAYWFRSCDGYLWNVTDCFRFFLTKKAFSSTKEIINKHERDVYKKEDWHYIDKWNINNNLAQNMHLCYSIEPCFWRNQPAYALCQKRAVVDRYSRVIGTLGQAIEILERKYSNFENDLLNIHPSKYCLTRASSFITNNYTQELPLTSRESECLFYILRGKSAKAIAQLLNLSPKTIEFYTDQLKDKFNCLSKSQLVERAIELGFLDLLPVSLMKS